MKKTFFALTMLASFAVSSAHALELEIDRLYTGVSITPTAGAPMHRPCSVKITKSAVEFNVEYLQGSTPRDLNPKLHCPNQKQVFTNDLFIADYISGYEEHVGEDWGSDAYSLDKMTIDASTRTFTLETSNYETPFRIAICTHLNSKVSKFTCSNLK